MRGKDLERNMEEMKAEERYKMTQRLVLSKKTINTSRSDDDDFSADSLDDQHTTMDFSELVDEVKNDMREHMVNLTVNSFNSNQTAFKDAEKKT